MSTSKGVEGMGVAVFSVVVIVAHDKITLNLSNRGWA